MLSFLVNRSSPALGRLSGPSAGLKLSPELARLYQLKNGFRALDDALLVLPAEVCGSLPGLKAWNSNEGWRRWFDLDRRLTFFAMDAVLRQFAVDSDGAVVRFDPVDERLSPFAPDLDVWAEQMIAGGAAQHLARSWQVMHRPLLVEERLLPSALGSGLSPMHLVDAMEQLGERVDTRLETSREYEVFELAF
ncbi:MAG: hypothetical protein Q8N23_10690 [Archangium sp.]|nr:hypothetical protein [Archangium sp.]MDP3153129.1 hypothetical protein [Archangium sp.]MDP3572262.1 hypothetical protein [Archangium sp.]